MAMTVRQQPLLQHVSFQIKLIVILLGKSVVIFQVVLFIAKYLFNDTYIHMMKNFVYQM